MNKIKVYLQPPWKFSDSSYYKYLVDCPPEGIEFQNTKKEKGVIINKNTFLLLNLIKKSIKLLLKTLNLSIPNAHLTPEGDYDIIHCEHCLSKNKKKPWVADIERMVSFAVSGWDTKAGKKKVYQILLQKNCKKILPWAESVKEDILKFYPKIKDKVEVLYPAVPEIKNLKKPKNKNLKIIFIARYFDIKGGLIALELLERLRKKYGIVGLVVADVSEKLRKKYNKLIFHKVIPQKELFKLMEQSDLFLYPGSVDTFGFSLLEAMSFGLPTITINAKLTKSRREIIENNKTGFIFDVVDDLLFNKIGKNEEVVIDKLFKNASKLIENKKLMEEMSKECIKTIKTGKFSIKVRNKKLRRIYKESLMEKSE